MGLLSFALAVLAAGDGPSCSAPAPTVYTHDATILTLVAENPTSDVDVPIRGRKNLVYSARDDMPKFISGPTSAQFPLIAQASAKPAADGDDAATANSTATIVAYAQAARQLLEEQLVTHGAVYFRGLPLSGALDFAAFIDALGWNAVKLGGGGTQRSDIAKGVRSASDEPPTQTIEPHMDMAHSKAHPTHIAFYCLEGPPPGVGGETVLTNMRGVYSDLEAQGVPQAFAEKGGVAYHKRLWSAAQTNHTGYTWQKFFFTEGLDEALDEVRKRDPGAIVAQETDMIDFQEVRARPLVSPPPLPAPHARTHPAHAAHQVARPCPSRARAPHQLRPRQVLPAVWQHPRTSEPIWFNGVHTNHRSYYVEAAHIDTSEGSPMDTTYADGSAIPESTIGAVRKAYWENSVAVRLQSGDLVVVDNYLASHGRMSWVPPNPRKVLLTHFVQGATAVSEVPSAA